LGLLLGYLATFVAKSDVIFLLGDSDYKGDEISRISLTHTGRQTTDAATETEGSHTVNVRAYKKL